MRSFSPRKLHLISARYLIAQAQRNSRFSTPSKDATIVPFLDGSVVIPPPFQLNEWTENGKALMVSLLHYAKASIENPRQYERKIQAQLLSLQTLYRERPGKIETQRMLSRFLTDLYPCVDKLPLAQWEEWKHIGNQIHDTYHLAATSGAWTPTQRWAFGTLIRLTSDPDMAEYWLAYQWRQCPIGPNKYDYATVIQVWARSNRQDAGEQAERVFRELAQKYLDFHKDPRWKPTEAAYVGWVVALISQYHKNRRSMEAAKRASAILQEAWDNAEHNLYWPGTTLYNSVLNAWARAGNPDKAEVILRDMMHKSLHYPHCTPDVMSFTTVINAWSKSGRKEAPENAETILELMEDHAVTRLKFNLRPTVVTYATVLNCWAKSNHPEAPLRASAILRHMRQADLRFRPNAVTYNTCMNAWARSGKASAPEEVERLFVEMKASGLRPDRITYMARINVLERSRRRDPQRCAANALTILNEMIKLADDDGTGHGCLYPTTLHFNRVLVTLGLAGDTSNAESILEHMIANWTRGLHESGPDRFSFHCVLSAHAKQMTKESAIRCVDLLDRMHVLDRMHGSGDDEQWPVAPNTVSYNTAMTAWVRTQGEDTLERVQTLVQRMKDSSIPLDQYSYASILQALAASSLPSDEKHERAVAMLDEMQNGNIEVTYIVRRVARKCLKHEYVEQQKEKS